MSVTLAAAAVAAAGQAYQAHQTSKKQEELTKSMKRSEDAANALSKENRERLRNIDLPSLTPRELEYYSAELNIEPEMMQAIAQDPSALESYEGDPRIQQNQMDALAQIAEVSKGELTDADRAAMAESQSVAGQEDRSRQEAILQSMARRGIAGSGNELAAKLASAQGASDRAASDSRSMLQGAQQRALEAMVQRGNLSGNIRGQAFGEATKKAGATDAINRFNTQNLRDVERINTGATNTAQSEEARAAYNQKNANTDLYNQRSGDLVDARSREFGNKLSVESAAAGQTPTLPTASSNLRSQEIAYSDKAGNDAAKFAGSALGSLYTEDDEDKKG